MKIQRIVSSVAVATLVLGGLVVTADPFTAGAATVPVPVITLSPDIGLHGGQAVNLTGSGFTPGASLVAVECNGHSKGVAACDTTSAEPITATSSGTFNTTFTATAGTIGDGTCGILGTDSLCYVAIGTSSDALIVKSSIAFAGGPGVSVSPSTGLSNTQSVTLTGSGFTAGDTVRAVECLATATTAAGCDRSTTVTMTVGPLGTLPSTYFRVATGKVGTGSCGTTVANYAACIIEVANAGGTDRGLATIDFVGPAVTASSAPVATRVSGPAVVGRSVAVVVFGKNFTAVSRIRGGAGSTVRVTRVTRTALHVTIKESARARVGRSTLVIVFKNGKSVRVPYVVRNQI